MKAPSTIPMAIGVVPSDSSSRRAQTTSKMREVAPVRKKAQSKANVACRVLTIALFDTTWPDL